MEQILNAYVRLIVSGCQFIEKVDKIDWSFVKGMSSVTTKCLVIKLAAISETLAVVFILPRLTFKQPCPTFDGYLISGGRWLAIVHGRMKETVRRGYARA